MPAVAGRVARLAPLLALAAGLQDHHQHHSTFVLPELQEEGIYVAVKGVALLQHQKAVAKASTAGDSRERRQRRRAADADEDEERPDPALLVQVQAHVENGGRLDTGQPRESRWFNEFSEGESTYNGDVQRIVSGTWGGWEPIPDNPYAGGGVEKAAWYHESETAGGKQAWQSHFPALTSGLAGHNAENGKWTVNGNGDWIQEYRRLPPDGGGGQDATAVKASGWFENSIRQYDGYARPRLPLPGSTQELIEGKLYSPHTVNTSVTCELPNCTANAVLQAFGAGIEARKCKFSLWLHPTDFDDGYSGERLRFIKVNGVTVNTDCFPMVDGCNASTQRPMFPCLQDMSLDTILNSSGALEISTAIPEVVDECPYEGNLLSAVAQVTCLLPPPQRLLSKPHAEPVAPAAPTAPPLHTTVLKSKSFRCDFRGCATDALLDLNEGPIPFKKCLVSVHANATDFDSEDGSREEIEYVRINSTTVVREYSPMKNPCRSKWAGTPLTPEEIEFPLVRDYDVTDIVKDKNSSGALLVEVKISPWVDECAHEGYLLTGRVDVKCDLDVEDVYRNLHSNEAV